MLTALALTGCPDFDRRYQRCVADGLCGDATAFALAPRPVTLAAVVGRTGRTRVTVTNRYDFPTGALAVTSSDPVFSIERDRCAAVQLAGGESCTFDVAFTSGIVEQRVAQLTVVASPGGTAFTDVTGESRAAAMLALAFTGDGTGTVAGADEGCTASCALQVPEGSAVTLTATADPGSSFEGWSGACTGTGSCALAAPSGSIDVGARFAQGPGTLTVDVDLDGGTVRFVPDGPWCGPACRRYTGRTDVAVTVTPPPARGLVAWSGCTRSSRERCDVSVVGDTVVHAQLAPGHPAFVSSATVVPGAFGGLAAGDQLCNALAHDAGLPGTFVAWLSTQVTPAPTRVGGGGWARTDGALFATNLTALLRSEPLVPLRFDERGRDVGAVTVATGTWQDGDFALFANCNDYKSDAGLLLIGASSSSSEDWTAGITSVDACAAPAHLYCFGVGPLVDLTPLPASPGRHAFASAQRTSGALGGLAGADALCNAEAVDAGLAGTFFAALATSTSAIADRFTGLGDGGWWRVDGVALGDGPTLASGQWQGAVSRDAWGRRLDSGFTWVGADGWSDAGTSTCADWTTAAGDGGRIVFAGSSMPFAKPDPLNLRTSIDCSLPSRVWCFER